MKMNTKNLELLIDAYQENYDMINNPQHDEKFKWRAARCFENVWFSEQAKEMPFSQKFALSMKQSSVLINNSILSPITGIVKMAEQKPAEVEALFTDLLFAPYESIAELQRHMVDFVMT